MMKTLRLVSLALFAVVLCSCRTTVPGPVYQIRVTTQASTTPIALPAVGFVQVDFSTGNPAQHFDTVPDMTFDGGISSHIEGSGTTTGDYIVEYPGDFVRASATPSSTGFDLILSFYSADAGPTMPPHGINPVVTVHVLDASRHELASGMSRPVWPLPTGQAPLIVDVICDASPLSMCNPP